MIRTVDALRSLDQGTALVGVGGALWAVGRDHTGEGTMTTIGSMDVFTINRGFLLNYGPFEVIDLPEAPIRDDEWQRETVLHRMRSLNPRAARRSVLDEFRVRTSDDDGPYVEEFKKAEQWVRDTHYPEFTVEKAVEYFLGLVDAGSEAGDVGEDGP